MNDEQIKSVEGWAVAVGAFQAYLDYVTRYEINAILQSGTLTADDLDIEKVVEDLKHAAMQHIADDISEYLPKVFGDLGTKLREATT